MKPFIPKYIYKYKKYVKGYKKLLNKHLRNRSISLKDTRLILVEQGEYFILNKKNIYKGYLATTLIIDCIIVIINGYDKNNNYIVGMAHIDIHTNTQSVYDFIDLLSKGALRVYSRYEDIREDLFNKLNLVKLNSKIKLDIITFYTEHLDKSYPSLIYFHDNDNLIGLYLYKTLKRFSYTYNREYSDFFEGFNLVKQVRITKNITKYDKDLLTKARIFIRKTIKEISNYPYKHNLYDPNYFHTILILDSFLQLYIKLKTYKYLNSL